MPLRDLFLIRDPRWVATETEGAVKPGSTDAGGLTA